MTWQRWKNIMKAYPFEEKRLAKWKPPYILQPKYDGVRCRAIPLEDGNYMLLSSEENVVFSVPHINEELNRTGLDIELDGELYNHDMSFEEIVSITSRTVNLHPDHKRMQFHIFDIVEEKPQMQRVLDLGKVRQYIGLNTILITAPFFVCDSLEDIMKVYDDLINTGYEGIIVRHISALYERKRSIWMMKFKPKKEDIYEIVGYQEEISISNTPKDTLGALVLKSGDGNSFNAGTGFSDQIRHILWEDRESLIGKFAKIQYQHLTSGKKVPRFPVFVEVVEDEKDEPVGI